MLKKAQVIMLPHNDNNAKITLYKTASGKPLNLSTNTDILAYHTNQHLYIISDDEIKEGDWHLNADKNVVTNTIRYTLCKATKIKLDFIKKLQEKGSDCKFYKIIATTDTSLKINSELSNSNSIKFQLPQPSQQFITKYIEEYNKGNVITDVLVEYEQDYTNRNCSTCNLGTDGTCELNLEKKCCSSTNNVTKHGDYWISCLDGEEDSEIYKIKVNPKDNSININLIN